MSDYFQRLFPADTPQLKALINENQQLKSRIEKFLQIQSYVELLLSKFHNAQTIIRVLEQQNAQLKVVKRETQSEIKQIFHCNDQQIQGLTKCFESQKLVLLNQIKQLQDSIYGTNSENQFLKLDTEKERARFSKKVQLLETDLKKITDNLSLLHNQNTMLLQEIDRQRRNYHQLNLQMQKKTIQAETVEERLQKQQNQLSLLNDQIQRLVYDKNTLQSHNQQLLLTIHNKDNDMSQMKQKLQFLNQISVNDSTRLTQELQFTKEQNAFLEQQVQKNNISVTRKNSEIAKLLAKTDEVEKLFSMECQTRRKIEQENFKLRQNISFLYKQLQQSEASTKRSQQQKVLYEKSCSKLETLIDKLNHKNLQLQKENHELTKKLSNPKKFTEKLQQQLESLSETFNRERSILLESFEYEKKKTKEMYQYSINEKQLEFQRQLLMFEQEIGSIKLLK